MAQLNLNRVKNRREPGKFESPVTPFDDKQFNFNKINKEEVLFKLVSRFHNDSTDEENNYVIINCSPIDKFHMLLVPQIKKGLPQNLNYNSILLAIDLLQLSSQPTFRVGFNSIHAWASVNHLHIHAMYCESELFVDNLPLGEHLINNLYLIHSTAPMYGFVFQLPFSDHDGVANEIKQLLDLFVSNSIPYTVLFTRGWHGTRVYVWPRKSTKFLANSELFDIACTEVGGHFVIRSLEEFQSISFEKCLNHLKAATFNDEDFKKIVLKIKSSF